MSWMTARAVPTIAAGSALVRRYTTRFRPSLDSRMGKNSCGRIASRTLVYFASLTTPTISIGVGVPGSLPKPTRRPTAGSPSRYCFTNASFAIATRKALLPPGAVVIRSSRSSKARPLTRRIFKALK